MLKETTINDKNNNKIIAKLQKNVKISIFDKILLGLWCN